MSQRLELLIHRKYCAVWTCRVINKHCFEILNPNTGVSSTTTAKVVNYVTAVPGLLKRLVLNSFLTVSAVLLGHAWTCVFELRNEI
jgi:hypothetical protein